MDEDKADELYRSFKQYDQAARFKQGLGFGSTAATEPAERDHLSGRDPTASSRRYSDASGKRSSPVPKRSHSDSYGRRRADNIDSDRWDPDGSPGGDRHSDHWATDRQRKRSSRSRSRSRGPRDRSRGPRDRRHRQSHYQSRDVDDQRRDRPERRSPSRSTVPRQTDNCLGRHRSRSRNGSPRRSRAVDSRHRQHSRTPTRRGSRSRSRSRRRSRSVGRRYSPSRSSRKPRQRSPRGRPRSPLHSRDRARSRSLDRNGRRVSDPDRRRDGNGVGPTQHASAAQPNFMELIEGYVEMTPAMRMKARTRYLLSQATKRAEDTGDGQWTRFKADPIGAKESRDVALDPSELKGHTGISKADSSHEAAIFGLPSGSNMERVPTTRSAAAARSDSSDDEDGPQIVELPESAEEATMQPSMTGSGPPKLSWREKAVMMKAKREAEIKANTPLLKFGWK